MQKVSLGLTQLSLLHKVTDDAVISLFDEGYRDYEAALPQRGPHHAGPGECHRGGHGGGG